LEAISPGDFAEVANNPISDVAPTVRCEGKLVLEFNDTNATVVKYHPIGPPEVMWIDVRAESGGEILKLWPAELHAAAKLDATDDVGESEGNEPKLPPREESTLLPPLQERILKIAHSLWPDGKLPPRVLDRNNQILNAWSVNETRPGSKTIARAFKNWTAPDN
jgi:hypothetical protein